jgi:hypothetical protein
MYGGKEKCTSEDDIKVNLKEIKWEGIKWI